MYHQVFRNNTRAACIKCGECCRKNGPALHLDDLHLLRNKTLDRKDLLLLRRGEPAMDNVLGRPVLLSRELIKIRSKKSDTTECIFLDPDSSLCTIHQMRPLECSLLECWNTGPLISKYQSGRLTRKEIFRPGSAMDELISLHEERCSVAELSGLLQAAVENPDKNQDKIKAMLGYDRSFRQTILEKTVAEESELLFYFGQPLHELMEPLLNFLRQHPDNRHP